MGIRAPKTLNLPGWPPTESIAEIDRRVRLLAERLDAGYRTLWAELAEAEAAVTALDARVTALEGS